MAQEPVSVVMVGIRGYGLSMLTPLLDAEDKSGYRLVGAVARNPDKCDRLADLQAMGVPTYPTLKDFYATNSCDLVIISTPIHLHLPQTCEALANGSNVLCEKPVAATIQEAKQMIEARDKSGKFVAIGYQWSFCDPIGDLKRDIQAGLFGAPKRLRTLVLWPRNEKYYARNTWAGVMRDDRGNWILDSPVNNATAHYLHNMFYVLGDKLDTSAVPVDVVAELYRAKDTENFDTGVLRCHTDTGVEIVFYSTHSVKETKGPVFSYEFENAEIQFGRNENESNIIAHFKDGSTKKYGSIGTQNDKKIWDAIDSVNTGETLACGIEGASSQTLALNGAHESMPEIVDFPKSLIKVTGEPGERHTWVEGLHETFTNCYDQGTLPSEANVPWSKPGRKIDLTNYKEFPST